MSKLKTRTILEIWKFFLLINKHLKQGKSDPEIFRQILQEFSQTNKITHWRKEVSVGRIDPDASLADAIKICNFHLVSPEINEENVLWQKESGKGAEIYEFDFPYPMTTLQIRKHLLAMKIEEPSILYLLAVSLIYHNVSDLYPLISLGTTWKDKSGNSMSPCFNIIDGRRILFGKKANDHTVWPVGYHFLGIKVEK